MIVSLNQQLYDLHKQLDIVQQLCETVSGGAEDVLAERAEITQILTTFYRAPLSLSSVQPLLDLAVRLNPALKHEQNERTRQLIGSSNAFNLRTTRS